MSSEKDTEAKHLAPELVKITAKIVCNNIIATYASPREFEQAMKQALDAKETIAITIELPRVIFEPISKVMDEAPDGKATTCIVEDLTYYFFGEGLHSSLSKIVRKSLERSINIAKLLKETSDGNIH